MPDCTHDGKRIRFGGIGVLDTPFVKCTACGAVWHCDQDTLGVGEPVGEPTPEQFEQFHALVAKKVSFDIPNDFYAANGDFAILLRDLNRDYDGMTNWLTAEYIQDFFVKNLNLIQERHNMPKLRTQPPF